VRKFDRAEHRRWSAQLVEKVDSLIVLDARFEEHIEHDLLGTIKIGTLSTEYYWLDRWYNVFSFRDPEGERQRFYCNVSMPPEFDGKTLSYVDLDIDVLVERDLSYTVLDLEDFEDNARKLEYPEEVRNQAHHGLAQLIDLIETKSFPFTDS
jgi:uncharacterized protein